MSLNIWGEIQRRVDEHDYMVGIERTMERVQATGEIFTPTVLVIEMLKRIPLSQLGPGRTVLDPACGDGQFLAAAKWVKVLHFGMSEMDALEDIFGIDIMVDNVELARARIGGGTIIVGDAMNPDRVVPGQTDEDRRLLSIVFRDDTAQQALFA